MNKDAILARWKEPWSFKARGIRPLGMILLAFIFIFPVFFVLFGVVAIINHRPLNWEFPGIIYSFAGFAGIVILSAIWMSLFVLGISCVPREVSLYGNGDIVREDSETPSRHPLRAADSVTLSPLNSLRTIWHFEVATHPFLDSDRPEARELERFDRIAVPDESTAALVLQHLYELGIAVQCAERPAYPTAPATVTCRIAYVLDREPTMLSRFMVGTLEVGESRVTISGPKPISLRCDDIRGVSFIRNPSNTKFYIVLDSIPRVYLLPVRWTLFGFFRFRSPMHVETNVYSALRARLGGSGLCAKCQRVVPDDDLPCACGTSSVEPRFRSHWIWTGV